jgi:hypothetical protein
MGKKKRKNNHIYLHIILLFVLFVLLYHFILHLYHIKIHFIKSTCIKNIFIINKELIKKLNK